MLFFFRRGYVNVHPKLQPTKLAQHKLRDLNAAERRFSARVARTPHVDLCIVRYDIPGQQITEMI